MSRPSPVLQPPSLIVGARVQLRRSSPDDAAAVFEAAADPEVMRYLDWPAHRDVDDARVYLEGCAARWAAGTEHHWVIEPRGGGALLGAITCRPSASLSRGSPAN